MVVHQSRSDSLNAPILCRSPFPIDIFHQVVSNAYLQVTVTNSDLEFSGTIGHDEVLENSIDITHLADCSLSENTPDIAWRTKVRTTTTGTTAYLLEVSSLHIKHYRYTSEIHHIPGSIHSTADEFSRICYLKDSQLLDYFNLNYPQKVFVAAVTPAKIYAIRTDILLAQKKVATRAVHSRDRKYQKAWDV